MDNEKIAEFTLESAASLFIVVCAYKLYRLKCHSESRCCGDSVHFDGENPGNAV